MSKYLETPSDVLTTNVLVNSLTAYVLDELKPYINGKLPQEYLDDNGERIIQNYINNSNSKLRMYGTAKELAENVKIFGDFPESHRYFKNDRELYQSSAVLYENLKGQKFISKQDIYTVIQNMALAIFPNSKTTEMRISIMTPLRCEENKLPKLLEFVKFEEKVFEEIEQEMKKVANTCITTKAQISEIQEQMEKGEYKGLCAKIPTFNGKVQTRNEKADIINRMETLCETKLGPAKSVQWFVQFFNKTIAMQCIQSVMRKRPELFGPKRKGEAGTVRLFEDGGQKFVMKAELFSAMNRRFGEEAHMFTTISWEEVEKMKNIGNIEFLLTPIHRAKHRPVAVKGHVPGEFGYLAVDALFDIMKTFTVGSKFFQRAKLIPLDDLFALFREAEQVFDPKKKTPYFIRQGFVGLFVVNFTELFQLATMMFPAKEVRNAKSDGFTVQNLKNELAHLELLEVFPEIEEHAEVVYEHVNGVKAEKYLRTCDLYDAVEYCQLICFFNRLPHYKQFIHNQGACPRVPGLNCQLCSGEKKEKKLQAAKTLTPTESCVKKEPIGASEGLKEQLKEAKVSQLESSLSRISISKCLICDKKLNPSAKDTIMCPMCRAMFP